MGQREIYDVLPDDPSKAIDTYEISRRIESSGSGASYIRGQIRRSMRALLRSGEVSRKTIPHSNAFLYWKTAFDCDFQNCIFCHEDAGIFIVIAESYFSRLRFTRCAGCGATLSTITVEEVKRK